MSPQSTKRNLQHPDGYDDANDRIAFQMAQKRRHSQPARRNRSRVAPTVFERRNYLLLLLGLALIIVGYVLMRWENEMDGFISLYLAPVLILGGYLEIIYAILWRPPSEARA